MKEKRKKFKHEGKKTSERKNENSLSKEETENKKNSYSIHVKHRAM